MTNYMLTSVGRTVDGGHLLLRMLEITNPNTLRNAVSSRSTAFHHSIALEVYDVSKI